MGHSYPIAETVIGALNASAPRAATRYDAEALAGDRTITALHTQWLSRAEVEQHSLSDEIKAGSERGFVQVYEDADGEIVFAVTYWKLGSTVRPRSKQVKKARPKQDKAPSKPKRRKRKRYADPNQLDLFHDWLNN
ncbi:MAG: hypothetical protein AAGI14_11880 [Pseudomonadota bacterium]